MKVCIISLRKERTEKSLVYLPNCKGTIKKDPPLEIEIRIKMKPYSIFMKNRKGIK